jgi:hypothetical protein
MLNGCLTLRRQDTSYVFHFGRLPLQVFDLTADPKQQRDLAARVPAQDRETAIDFMLGTQLSVEREYDRLTAGRSPP